MKGTFKSKWATRAPWNVDGQPPRRPKLQWPSALADLRDFRESFYPEICLVVSECRTYAVV